MLGPHKDRTCVWQCVCMCDGSHQEVVIIGLRLEEADWFGSDQIRSMLGVQLCLAPVYLYVCTSLCFGRVRVSTLVDLSCIEASESEQGNKVELLIALPFFSSALSSSVQIALFLLLFYLLFLCTSSIFTEIPLHLFFSFYVQLLLLRFPPVFLTLFLNKGSNQKTLWCPACILSTFSSITTPHDFFHLFLLSPAQSTDSPVFLISFSFFYSSSLLPFFCPKYL